MKTTGKEWNAFLASWPEDQYMEDANILINGAAAAGQEIADSDKVEVLGGVVYANAADDDYKYLIRMFSKWKKSQTQTSFFVTCDTPKKEAVIAAVKAAGGKVE